METVCMLDRDLKRGSTEMLIMAMVEDRPRHGPLEALRYE